MVHIILYRVFSDYGYGSFTKIDMLQGEAYGTKNIFIGSSTGLNMVHTIH